jgi:hypothetical protein
MHGLDISRTVILDKTAKKIIPEEQKVLVLLPEWDMEAYAKRGETETDVDKDCDQLPLMLIITKLLLAHLGPGSSVEDTADVVPSIQQALDEVCVRNARESH